MSVRPPGRGAHPRCDRVYICAIRARPCAPIRGANGNVPQGESVKVIQMSEETQETRPVNGKSMYSYIADAWNVPSKSYVKELNYERRIQWRKEENFCRIERPTRLDRARALGYKAKQGYVVVRARVRKGSFQKRAIVTGRRAKRKGEVPQPRGPELLLGRSRRTAGVVRGHPRGPRAPRHQGRPQDQLDLR